MLLLFERILSKVWQFTKLLWKNRYDIGHDSHWYQRATWRNIPLCYDHNIEMGDQTQLTHHI